jgi:hypothetical protein
MLLGKSYDSPCGNVVSVWGAKIDNTGGMRTKRSILVAGAIIHIFLYLSRIPENPPMRRSQITRKPFAHAPLFYSAVREGAKKLFRVECPKLRVTMAELSSANRAIWRPPIQFARP